jgi:hypothetical protein
MKVLFLQIIHLVIATISLASFAIVATQWDNAFEFAVAFLLLCAKVNSWTMPRSCILTRIEAKWRGVADLRPIIFRFVDRVRKAI